MYWIVSIPKFFNNPICKMLLYSIKKSYSTESISQKRGSTQAVQCHHNVNQGLVIPCPKSKARNLKSLRIQTGTNQNFFLYNGQDIMQVGSMSLIEKSNVKPSLYNFSGNMQTTSMCLGKETKKIYPLRLPNGSTKGENILKAS